LHTRSKGSERKSEMLEEIKNNTRLLDTITVLMEEKRNYERRLDSQQKKLGSEYAGVKKSDIKERDRLMALVQMQAHDIESLKREITLLSRKGGHVLPPVQHRYPAPPTRQNIQHHQSHSQAY